MDIQPKHRQYALMFTRRLQKLHKQSRANKIRYSLLDMQGTWSNKELGLFSSWLHSESKCGKLLFYLQVEHEEAGEEGWTPPILYPSDLDELILPAKYRAGTVYDWSVLGSKSDGNEQTEDGEGGGLLQS